MLSLDHPHRISLLHDLKAAANAGAKPDGERAMDSLVQLREDARFAQVMARTGVLAEPEDLKAARTEAARVERAAAAARNEAEAAAKALSNHRTMARPRWRRAWGWMTGANDRHRAIEATLLVRSTESEQRATEVESLSRKAADALKRGVDRHTASSRTFREGWQVEASHAAERIAAVEAALELLHQRPELARMGPGGLLKIGYRITETQNRAELDKVEDLTVQGPGWP